MRTTIKTGTALALACLASATMARADTVSLTPSNTSNTVYNSSSPPGSTDGSLEADVPVGDTNHDKSEFYVTPGQLFGHDVTVGDIASISYWTNKPGNAGSPDWVFLIYTNTTGANDSASWYHSRLNFEPYLTGTSNANDPSNTWHEWSTGDLTNPMRFYDEPRSGNFGTYTDPTLSGWQSSPPVYHSNPNDYASETIEYFSLQTGSTWAAGFTGLVSGLTITLKDGEVGTATVTPEPSSMALLGLGALGLVGYARRRKSGATNL